MRAEQLSSDQPRPEPSHRAPEPTRADPVAPTRPGRPTPDAVIAPGTVLDRRYRLEERVGRGGSATVYRGTDTILQRPVAVKVFNPDARDGALLERRAREMRLAAVANDPHLVAVYDAHLDEATDGAGPCYLVTEFIDGPNLSDLLDPDGLPPDVVRRIGADIGQALDALHERGLVHRDVKPGNILLTADRQAKLADLGIARELDGHPLTQDRAVPGTVPYLSPEQAQGHEVGPPSDVYSLGLVLLECLTGRREFPGGALESAVARLLRDPVIPADLPDPWPDVLEAMTDREPDRRPSAAGVAAALSVPFPDRPLSETDRTVPVAVAVRSEPPGPKATGRHRARRRPAWIVAGVLAAAVATGVVVAVNSADTGGADGSDPARPPTSTVTTEPVVPTVTVTAAAPSVAGPGASVPSGDPSTQQPADPVPAGQPATGSPTGDQSAADTPAPQPPPESPGPDVPAPDAGPGSGPADGGGSNRGGNGNANGAGNGNGGGNGGGNGNGNGNGNGR